MATPVHYTQCPVCGAADISNVFPVRDYTVSQQEFMIMSCAACTARFTQDVPAAGEIGAYYKSEDYISHTNSSKGLVNRLYQWVRRRTLRQKRKGVQSATGLRQGRILDLGCGTGAFVHEMQQQGWQVTGLEPDPDAREVGRQVYGLSLEDTAAFYSLPPTGFDAITLWHVLEHVHDLHGYVAQLARLVKPNGRLFIAVPNYTSADAAHYQQYWAAYDVPRHLYHFSPESVKGLMQKHGLRVLACRPMWYDSFYVSLLSSKYKSGRTKLVSAFFNGLRSNIKAVKNVERCSSIIYVIGH